MVAFCFHPRRKKIGRTNTSFSHEKNCCEIEFPGMKKIEDLWFRCTVPSSTTWNQLPPDRDAPWVGRRMFGVYGTWTVEILHLRDNDNVYLFDLVIVFRVYASSITVKYNMTKEKPKPGQKFPTPTAGSGDRVFYETLLRQRPDSAMAQEW